MENTQESQVERAETKPKVKWNKTRVTLWVIAILVLMFLAVQYLNASKYDALVQVYISWLGVRKKDKFDLTLLNKPNGYYPLVQPLNFRVLFLNPL